MALKEARRGRTLLRLSRSPRGLVHGYLLGHPGIGIRELARGLEKNPATVLEQVAQLEEAGLVVKETTGARRPAKVHPLIQELNIRVARGAKA